MMSLSLELNVIEGLAKEFVDLQPLKWKRIC